MSDHSSDVLVVPRARDRVTRTSGSTRALCLLAADLAAFAVASLLVLLGGLRMGEPAGLMLDPDDRGLLAGGAPQAGCVTLLVLSALVIGLALRGRYTERLTLWASAGRLAGAIVMALMADSFLRTELFGVAPESTDLLRWLLLLPCSLVLREGVRRLLQARGLWGLRTVIVGDGQAVRDVRAALTSDPSLGYEVVRTVGLHRALAFRLGNAGAQALRALGAEFVVVAMGGRDPAAESDVAAALSRAQVPFALVPAVEGVPVSTLSTQYFVAHDIMLLASGNNLARPACRIAKGVFDQVVAAFALLVLSPLFLVLCAVIRLDGGPAFFAHGRLGEGGQRFRCLKFRSMSVHADAILADLLARDPVARIEWEATQKLRHDPRITRIGQMLRRTSLDELPQLLNVLRGEMSLVGPRPIVDAEACRYGDKIGYYYETKPGMTGLWQVSGRSNTSYEHRVRLDVWYVRNWTLLHDVMILLRTVPAVLGKHGAV